MSQNFDILRELSPLSDNDCFYVIERKKQKFTFPIHTHNEFELNYIENGEGAQRVVGDSVETIGNFDLVLITGEHLEHAWQNSNNDSSEIREITIQFSSKLLDSNLLGKNQFLSIKTMFSKAQNGMAFPLVSILKVRSLLKALTREDNGFYTFITFLNLLYELSLCKDAKILSSTSFAKGESITENDRIKAVDAFLQKNYGRDIKLFEVAELVHMNQVSFSRYFKMCAGSSFTDYLTELRIGHVIRMLVDSNQTIAEVCYLCGFNNISNFNRIFKRRKGCSPREFRELYKKKRIIV